MPHALVGDTITGPWVLTPAFLKDRARAIHDALTNMSESIDKLRNGSRIDPNSGRYKAWKRTLDRWGAWYGQTSGTSWLWSGTEATLESWESTVRDWRSWLRMTFPDTSSDLPEAPHEYTGPMSGGTKLPWWAWLGIVGTAGYCGYKILK